jgi:hypothetical protein
MKETMTITTAYKTARPAALVALTASALTAAALGATPTANATCISAFGLGSGGQCTSTLASIAIAIGENAEAHADGFLGAALTLGNASSAETAAGALMNFAVTFGDNNFTLAGGIASIALAANGINQAVIAGDGGFDSGNIANIAVSLTSPESTQTIAAGIGNLSVNFAGGGNISGVGVGLTTVNAVGLGSNLFNAGILNNITNLSGNNVTITNDEGDGGIGNFAFNVIGEDNVITTRGALAVAGAFGSVGQTVAQDGFGINVSFLRQSAGRSPAQVVRPAAATVESASAADSDSGATRASAVKRTRGSR